MKKIDLTIIMSMSKKICSVHHDSQNKHGISMYKYGKENYTGYIIMKLYKWVLHHHFQKDGRKEPQKWMIKITRGLENFHLCRTDLDAVQEKTDVNTIED